MLRDRVAVPSDEHPPAVDSGDSPYRNSLLTGQAKPHARTTTINIATAARRDTLVADDTAAGAVIRPRARRARCRDARAQPVASATMRATAASLTPPSRLSPSTTPARSAAFR